MGDALPAGRPMGSFGAWGRWCRDPLLALGCRDPVLRVAEAKAADPQRRLVLELFDAWWNAHGETPIAVAELAESVRAVADPRGRGRQYLRVVVGRLEGARAGGFVLVRSPSAGKWNADLFVLVRTGEAEGHGTHRTHEGGPSPAEEVDATGGSLKGPMDPMPLGTDPRDATPKSGFDWEETLCPPQRP
jgi:hypothetical protein